MRTGIFSFGRRKKTLGLALGGGGARGLVHVRVLQVLDELGIRPKAVSGASIGAVMGALYCSGKSGNFIHSYVDQHIRLKPGLEYWREDSRRLMNIVRLLDMDFSGTGLIKGEKISHFLYQMLEGEIFSDLEIPLRIVATDLWNSRAVVFDEGEVLPAVKASMSIPGVFAPVEYRGHILVDGACSNPVPWDLLEDCDIVIGVNALGRSRAPDVLKPPKAARTVLESFDVIQRGILAEKNRCNPPDLLLDPPIYDIGVLEFHKAESVYEQCEDTVQTLRAFLKKHF